LICPENKCEFMGKHIEAEPFGLLYCEFFLVYKFQLLKLF
jgi:hypothetical protein